MIVGRTFPREELDEMVQHLSNKYPAAFYTQPHLPVPLKRDIVDDLGRDGTLDAERRNAAVGFYTQGWDYERALQAGVKRVDLNGAPVGTVTQAEQTAALKRVQAQKQALRDKQGPNGKQSPVEVVRRLHANGQIPDDQLSKITAPPPPKKASPMVKPKTPPTPVDGTALTQLRMLWSNIDGLLAKTDDSRLQAALAVPALKLFVIEAEKLIATAEGGVTVAPRVLCL